MCLHALRGEGACDFERGQSCRTCWKQGWISPITAAYTPEFDMLLFESTQSNIWSYRIEHAVHPSSLPLSPCLLTICLSLSMSLSLFVFAPACFLQPNMQMSFAFWCPWTCTQSSRAFAHSELWVKPFYCRSTISNCVCSTNNLQYGHIYSIIYQ